MSIKSHRTGHRTNARKQRGDTMIEVLVTVIIIAVGVLGAAALQVTTLKNLSSSHSASVASIVAEDLGERIRANPEGALDNDYVHSSPPEDYENCTQADCSAKELAMYDLATWWSQMTSLLPAASAEVTRNAGTDTFVLTVRWDDDRSGSTGTNCPVKSDEDLECFQLNITI